MHTQKNFASFDRPETNIIVHEKSDGSKLTIVDVDETRERRERVSIRFTRLDSFTSTDDLDVEEEAARVGGDPTQKCTYINNQKECSANQSGKGGPYCHQHTCPHCGASKRTRHKMCTINKEGKADCPTLHADEHEEAWEHSKWPVEIPPPLSNRESARGH